LAQKLSVTMQRYLGDSIRNDVAEKMVLLAGPREVGRTTLAREILAGSGDGVYLNWDRREDRREIRAARWPGGQALVVLDELHKWRDWKRFIKSEFDSHRERLKFLVTGGARLDVYRRGGDSLQGRYHHYRLHPLSSAEVAAGRRSASIVSSGRTFAISNRCATSRRCSCLPTCCPSVLPLPCP
jgi:hypothetical protein